MKREGCFDNFPTSEKNLAQTFLEKCVNYETELQDLHDLNLPKRVTYYLSQRDQVFIFTANFNEVLQCEKYISPCFQMFGKSWYINLKVQNGYLSIVNIAKDLNLKFSLLNCKLIKYEKYPT